MASPVSSSISNLNFIHQPILIEYIHIGKIAATHGLQGEVVLKHVLGQKTNFKNASAIFIEKLKGEYLPYFHEISVIKNDSETIIKLEGIATKEAAAILLQKKVWLTKTDFDNLVSKVAPVNLIGFIVLNNNKRLAEVEVVIEQPLQVLLQLTMQNKEVLIPLNEQTLLKIDRKKKEIYVSLPDGLLEIYLG